MVDLTILTIVFEFVPPLIATFVYLLFFGKRKSKLIESFIILMYAKTITWFLLTIYRLPVNVSTGFDSVIDTSTLSWLLLLDLLSQFFISLQEYLIWVMVSFIAVLFGMLVLGAKLTLQDPLKMVFKNLIKRIVGREPESDGYSGLQDRLQHISFKGLEINPLDPAVQARAWRQAWKDYLIIGLVTVVPSISVYAGGMDSFIIYKTNPSEYVATSNYLIGVLVFLTWIYRFGYPASSRIAKAAGLHLGERDLGAEMMQGVLGWFFRLNILLTLYFLADQTFTVLNSGLSDAGSILLEYYVLGLGLAVPPILFAIIVLPYAEDFSAVFYKRIFDALTKTRSKIRETDKRAVVKNAMSAIATAIAVTGAFIGAVFASTLNYATQSFFAYGLFSDNRFRFLPGSVDNVVEHILDLITTPIGLYPGASVPRNNVSLLAPTTWTLLMLAIPFAAMLLIGVLGYFIRGKAKGGSESFAVVSGVLVSIATYFALPEMDYILGVSVTPATYAGEVFYRLRPIPFLPEAEDLLLRYASQFIINLPLYVFTALFILYFFEYRSKWRETTGEATSSLLNVQKRDLVHSTLMFVGGLVISIFGVWIFTLIIQNPGFVTDVLFALFRKIGDPDGLEGVLLPVVGPLTLIDPGGWFVVFAEHNIVRTLLMLVMGPVFWSAVLWFIGAEKSKSESNIGLGSLVGLVCLAAASILLTQYDAMNGVFDPHHPIWGFTSQLGLRALFIFGIPILIILILVGIRYIQGKGIGAWWFPLFIFIFAAEYFAYDDQFTLIAIIVLPAILAAAYRLLYGKADDVRTEDFLITYIRFSLMSVAIAEVLSTALFVGGITIIDLTWGGNIWEFLAGILPHAIIEIPIFLLAAALSIRVARSLGKTIQSEDWKTLPTQTRALLSDTRTWRTFVIVAFFLVIAAIIEAYVTPIIVHYVANLL